MKLFNVFLLGAVTFFLVACGSAEPKDKLVGTWAVTSVSFQELIDNMSDEQIQMIEAAGMTLMDLLEEAEEEMKKMKMSFDAEGNVTITGTRGGDQTGTWSLNEDAKVLTIVTDNKSDELEIKSLESSSMMVYFKEGNDRFLVGMNKE